MNKCSNCNCENRTAKLMIICIAFTIIIITAILLMCILFSNSGSGLTLELDNKRASVLLNDENILWNKNITSVNNNISYDSTTGEITFNRSGCYYISYYFNVIPNTINSDFCFEFNNDTTTKLIANGSGSSSGSPTTYVNAQGVFKVNEGERYYVDFHSIDHNPILLGDTVVQGNITIFRYAN